MPEGLPQKSLRGSHFYPECNGQPPEGFKERSDIIWLRSWKDHLTVGEWWQTQDICKEAIAIIWGPELGWQQGSNGKYLDSGPISKVAKMGLLNHWLWNMREQSRKMPEFLTWATGRWSAQALSWWKLQKEWVRNEYQQLWFGDVELFSLFRHPNEDVKQLDLISLDFRKEVQGGDRIWESIYIGEI